MRLEKSQRGGSTLEREGTQIRAAESAFAAAFAGARVVDRGVQCGDGAAWSWIAELPGGRICAVLLLTRAGREDAAALLDGAAELAEHEEEVRRMLGLPSSPSRGGPFALAICDEASRAFERLLALTDPQCVDAFALLRVSVGARSRAVLRPLRTAGSAQKSLSRSSSGADSYSLELGSDPYMLATLQNRMQRLDAAVEVEREGLVSTFRIHGHELARVQVEGEAGAESEGFSAYFGDDPAGLTVNAAEDLERFFARVIERYLELGAWSGAVGGAAALALGEPLLSHEELAAFRELA
jgi:hypothetical protein